VSGIRLFQIRWKSSTLHDFENTRPIVAKRCGVGSSLLLATNKYSIRPFKWDKIIDIGWPSRSLTTSTVGYPSNSWVSCFSSHVYLLQIYGKMWQWTNFQNRSTFGEDTDESWIEAYFFGSRLLGDAVFHGVL